MHVRILIAIQCRGKTIAWDHLKWLYNADTSQGAGLRLLPKLKLEHINLTPFSKMRVDLAAQVSSYMHMNAAYHVLYILKVLSESVSKALVLVCGDEVMETAHLAEMMDKFLDALNVHNFSHGVKSLKGFHTSGEDHRLKVMCCIITCPSLVICFIG